MIQAGLCADCRYGRPIRSHRGSAFLFCERSRNDRRFTRYPQLPVYRCAGYQEQAGDGDADPNPGQP